MAYLRLSLRKNRFIDSLVEHFIKKIMKTLNASIINFIILKSVKKVVLEFHVTTATDICLKEVTDSSPCWALWRKSMETLKALILTIIT